MAEVCKIIRTTEKESLIPISDQFGDRPSTESYDVRLLFTKNLKEYYPGGFVGWSFRLSSQFGP